MVGQKVLAGLAKGRAIWQQMQAEERVLKERLVLQEYLRLKLADRPDWGISGVIAQSIRRQGITLSTKQIKRYLDALSGVSKSMGYSAGVSHSTSITLVGG